MCWTCVLDLQPKLLISKAGLVILHLVQVQARVTFLVSDLMRNQVPSVQGLALHRMRHDAVASWPNADISSVSCKGRSSADAHGCLYRHLVTGKIAQ